MKLKTKTLLMILGPVFLIFVAASGLVGMDVYKTQKEDAIAISEAYSKDFASEVLAELDESLDSAKTVKLTVEGLMDRGLIDREAVKSVIKNTLRDNEKLIGLWVGFEPNAFDGRDAELAGSYGHDATGRFIPYLVRDGSAIREQYLEDYSLEGAGDYYQLALKKGTTQLLEPFEYNVDGKTILMTTFAVPIERNGKVIGVAGADVALDSLKEIGSRAKFYETGYGRLISYDGNVVVHPDETTLGKPAGEFKTGDADDVLKRIRAGEVFTESIYSQVYDYNVLKSFAPVLLEGTDTPWFFSTVVPETEVMAKANKLLVKMLVIYLIGLIAIGLAVFFVITSIVKPIVNVTNKVEKFANYDFTEDMD